MYLNDEYLKGSMPLTMASFHSDMPQRPTQPQVAAPQMHMNPVYASAPSIPQQSFAPPAPASGHASPAAPGQRNVEGKQFFRMARSQLSYEAFNEFLANIKRLNN